MEDTELREQILIEFKQVHKLAPADYTENCTNVVMSMVKAHYGAKIVEARIDEVQNSYNGIQHLLMEDDDSDEVVTQFQIECKNRLTSLKKGEH